MANLRELSSYQEVIFKRLVNNDNIVRAVADIAPNFLSNPLGITGEPSGSRVYEENGIIYQSGGDRYINKNRLPYKRIYPWQYSDKVSEEAATYITFYFPPMGVMRRAANPVYTINKIGFTAYTHSSLMRTDEGCLRTLFIVSEIDEMMSGSFISNSIGEISLVDWGSVALMEGRWHGHSLLYTVADLKLPLCDEEEDV